MRPSFFVKQLGFPIPDSRFLIPDSGLGNLQSGIWNLQSGISNPESEIHGFSNLQKFNGLWAFVLHIVVSSK
jgi:hypothetical protein